ncbi:uncharacterized protein K02A2.6 [Trichonephila clavipes]|nr:uncharacterized protein K02A2.6 [Trichonephila clavipes]
MEQQIADLLRQNQDLIRALQIREDSHSHKVTVQFEKFDEENENFDSFVERFETYLDVQNVPIANRAKVFVSSLSAKLYQLLKNLLAPDIPSDQTLDKLKDALKKHLTPKPLIIPSRHKFLNRKQTAGEGISTYIAELRALAMNCDYDKDMLSIMLRDVFVSGLRDKMILDRLFEEDNINLEKTLNIALAMEKAFRGTNDIMGRAINSMQTFKKHMEKNPILQKAERKHYIVHDAQVPTMQKRIVDLFQVHVISVGKLGTLNRHASHLKRQMRNRLNKNRFLWSKDCQVAFEQIKKEICSPKILVHYDPSLPLTLASDASPVGIGCVLSHVYPDGSERRRFTLITDHKPLIAIFGSKRGLPVLAATRLLHYALILQSFEFDIIFRKTIEHGNADFLSRLPKTSEELEVKDDITIFQMSQIEALPVTSKELRQETSKDIELGPLLRALREGKDLQGREAQYTIEDGCIMYGQRVCIPRKFRKNVLEELHAGHLGIVKMKAIARSFVYWKNIDNDIEEAAKNCVDCARYKANPPKSKVHYWEYPSMPWERIHVDFAGPIFEHTFFLIVDAHSKWLEVYPMKVTTTKKTIECLRDSFARFGLPRVLVSDNGSQFTSYEFQRFMHKNGVRHKTSVPFKPSSNGQAERYVATLKQSLRAMHKYEGTIQQKLSTFLMQYRKAPNVTTTLSPAMLFLKRDIRTRIDLLLPELKTKIQDKLRRDNFEFRDRKFDVGDRVAVRVYRAANTRWKFGTIVNQDGVLHYIIDVQGTLVRRHVDQIRPVGDKVQENIIPLMHQRFPSSEVRENNSNIQHAETAEDISKDRNKELGSSSVQGVPSTDVAVPDLSQSSAKETDSRRGVHQFQTGHYLGVPGESGGLRRDLFFKEGGDVELWFQQDGVTCHTARATIDLLKDTFGDRLISRFGPVNWPPRSCDLTPLDYFLWDYVKSLVYEDKPQTFDHLEDNIRRVIADIRPQTLEKVIENWTSRLDYIRASRGSHMPEIIFKM